MTFDKRAELFPVKQRYVYLAHCGASPLYSAGLQRQVELSRMQTERGAELFACYGETLERLHTSAARLMKTSPDNLSFHRNTSEGMSMIASGYPFSAGDQVISYVHEYPANHYPWRLQERRGVELIELGNHTPPGVPDCGERPVAFSIEELVAAITPRTRVIALSHAQFTSGYAVDLAELGALCRERDIDLIIDVAQSLGSLPVYPEEHGVAAALGSGWKWLLGPLATALMYTSPRLRDKLDHVLVGAELMTQWIDFLDHRWQPHSTAKRFEYSTSSPPLAAALEASIAEVHLRYAPEAIRDEIFRLQDLLLARLDRTRYTPVVFSKPHRSGILSLICQQSDPLAVEQALKQRGFVCSVRGDYLRFAPHFYITDDEVLRFVEVLNEIEV